MKRYFFEITYNGKHFYGWQRQPNGNTVQETMETCLSQLYANQPIGITGCGRTDTGVHAKHYFFHTDLPEHDLLSDIEQFIYKLNRMLPKAIAVLKMFPCNLHARFDAISRTYRYYISQVKDPFKTESHLYIPDKLSFDLMNSAAYYLLGKQDFTSLAKLHTDVKTNICSILKAEWKQASPDSWYFEITSDRFLRNMVRSTVGTLFEVGRGKILPSSILDILGARDRSEAATSVPAQGLYLWHISYDFNV